MKDLLTLLVIFIFFIFTSLVIGAGVYLIEPAYAYQVAGSLLVLSSLAVVWQFFKEFGGK